MKLNEGAFFCESRVNILEFNANSDEPSIVKLYDRMIKIYKIPGYVGSSNVSRPNPTYRLTKV